MIGTVCYISLLRLWNNRQELAMAFIVPVLFFSIFALIFSRGVGQTISRVRVSFVDDDRTPESLAIIQAACQHPEILAVTKVGRSTDLWPIARLSRWLICQRQVEVVVHIPVGFTTQDPDNPKLSIALHNEGLNPIGHRLVQASLAEAIALQFAEAGVEQTQPSRRGVSLALATSPATSQVTTLASNQPLPTQPSSQASQARPSSTLPVSHTEVPLNDSSQLGSQQAEPTVFKSIDAFAGNKRQPKVAMYAAGIAVMFLLFSANGVGASILEEREAGTLGRLLLSRLSLSQFLLGKWLYIAGLGCTQLAVMFVWGELVFQVGLREHLLGFAVMASATSAACASFALFLAAVCRSRQQLHGVSVVLVLTMSAMGGSMVPRYVMSDTMRGLGKFTFNGWALDGFQKIFWYDLPLSAIRTEVCVLIGISLALGLVARLLAHRWSAA